LALRPLATALEAHYSLHSDIVSVVVKLRNSGNGPALDTNVSLRSGAHTYPPPGASTNLPPGDTANLHGFQLPTETRDADVAITNADLSGRLHETATAVRFRPPDPPATQMNNPDITSTRVRRRD
jgi:hypothetical protein